jgi:hypothetical protein
MTSHKRSIGDQIKTGLFVAGELVGGFLVFLLAAVGLGRLISAASTSHFTGPLTAWIELGLGALIIFATAERWVIGSGPLLIAWGVHELKILRHRTEYRHRHRNFRALGSDTNKGTNSGY